MIDGPNRTPKSTMYNTINYCKHNSKLQNNISHMYASKLILKYDYAFKSRKHLHL